VPGLAMMHTPGYAPLHCKGAYRGDVV